MSSESNLYRTENYQNYINSFHQKPKVAKSISEIEPRDIKKSDDDADSINSVAESLNNYLDMKVCGDNFLCRFLVDMIDYFMIGLNRLVRERETREFL